MDDRRSRRCASGGCAGARHARRTGRHDDPAELRHGAPHEPPRDRHRDAAHDRGHDRLHRPRRTAARRRSARERMPEEAEEVIARLAELRDALGGPRPEFRARLRETLLSAHEELRRSAPEGSGGPAADRAAAALAVPPPAFRPSLRVRLRSAALALALLAALLGMSWGVQHAVPGDTLYPIKRATESALIRLSVDETARAERELDTAHNRATEVAVLAADPAREKLLEKTIDDMASTTRSAIRTLTRAKGNARDHGKLRRFAAEQRNVVEPLIPALNGSSKEKASAYLHLIAGFEDP